MIPPENAPAQPPRPSAAAPPFAPPPASLVQAMVLHQKGRLPEAEALYRSGLAAEPGHIKARSLFGYLLFQTKRSAEALVVLDEALAVDPAQADAHAWRGLCLMNLGRGEEATLSFQEAVRLEPRHMGAHNNLGLLLFNQRRAAEAISHLTRAVELGWKRPEPFVLIARAHRTLGRLVEAEQAFREALRIDPGFTDARMGLAGVLHDLGDIDAGIGELRATIRAQPRALGARSNLLMRLLYHGGVTPEEVAEEHREAGRAYLAAHAGSGDRAWRARSPDPDRRLRVGYLSPDFHLHATAFFLEPLLAAHDPASVEVFCYHSGDQRDATTDRLRGLVPGWRDVHALPVRDAAACIAEDRIDVLVDCAGHTNDHRLPVLAMKPAPVQVTWLGYPHGTGLTTVDYRLSDAIADPPGMTEGHYVEELLRLPEGTFCYQAPASAPEPAPGPLERGEGPVFGCFNNPIKIGPEVVRLWAEIVGAVPDARLRLAARQFVDPAAADRMRDRFAAAGLSRDRIEIAGRRTFSEGFGLYATIDVALDPFPYHGTTSTCEALWMAVPVVTLPGRSCVSRVGPSLLARVGLDDLVARDAAHYRDIAVDLISHPARLADLRRTLRGRMARSPLCDGPRFARQMEAAYREVWQRWCRGEARG